MSRPIPEDDVLIEVAPHVAPITVGRLKAHLKLQGYSLIPHSRLVDVTADCFVPDYSFRTAPRSVDEEAYAKAQIRSQIGAVAVREGVTFSERQDLSYPGPGWHFYGAMRLVRPRTDK